MLRTRTPYIALLPVLAGVFIAADDQTVVVTVLPRIMLDLEVPFTQLDRASWTITGYLLGYVCAMPFIGRLSDILGRRSLYLWFMALFMAGSAVVALTPTLEWLIAARVFQAMAAGALVPISIAIVSDLFPAEKRGLPLGLVGASAEAGGVIGPLWGGIITRYLDWQWVFWINIPLGFVVLVGTLMLLTPSPVYRAKIDFVGGILVAAAIATLTLGLSRIDAADVLMVVYLAASGAAIALFVVWQRSTPEPLLPPAMFRSRIFGGANVTHLLIGGALIIGMVTIPLMANTVLDLTPLEGGLRLMRLTVAIPVGAVLGGLACQRMGYSVPTITGLGLAALGFFFMSGWGVDVADPGMTVHLLIAGLGFGLVIAPIALAATNSVREEHRGAAAGLITAMRMVGMTFGVAALTAWGTERFGTLVAGVQLPFHQSTSLFESQLVDAGLTLFSDFFLIAMCVSLVAIIPAALMVRGSDRDDE